MDLATATFIVVVSGINFPEGPAWGPDGKLYLSAVKMPATLRIDDIENRKWSVVREGGSNGLAFDPQGRIVFCDHKKRLIARREKDGRISVLADRYQGKRFSQPNDLVMDANGTIYFTDPDFFRNAGVVYRLSADGALSRVATDIKTPNGIALRDGAAVLLVGATREKRVYEIRLDPDGAFAGKRMFVDLAQEGLIGPDGMCLDRQGNLYVAIFAGGRVVKVNPAGTILQRFDVDGKSPTNCTFGGADHKTLFVTETEKGRILAFRLDVSGQTLPVTVRDRK